MPFISFASSEGNDEKRGDAIPIRGISGGPVAHSGSRVQTPEAEAGPTIMYRGAQGYSSCNSVNRLDIITFSPDQKGRPMARKTVFVSDFSSKEISDPKQSATVTVRYGDGRRGAVVADAHVDDKIISEIAKARRPQARRGRRPKSEA